MNLALRYTVGHKVPALSISIFIPFIAISITTNVTRLGDLLDFGQLFKAFGNNLFAQISYILRQFL